MEQRDGMSNLLSAIEGLMRNTSRSEPPPAPVNINNYFVPGSVRSDSDIERLSIEFGRSVRTENQFGRRNPA